MSRLRTKQRRARRWRTFEAANMYTDGFGEMHLDAWAFYDAGYRDVQYAIRRGWRPDGDHFAFTRRLA